MLELARIAVSEKKNDEGQARLDKLLARDAENYDGLMLKASLSLAKNEPAKAAAVLEMVVKNYPRSAQAHYDLGLAYLAGNEMAKGLASLNRSVAVDPKLAAPRLALAELKMREGDFISVITSLKKLVQEQPKLTRAQLMLAEAYRAKGDAEDALQVYGQLRQSFPNDPQVPLLMGFALVEQRKEAAARQAFEDALKLSPDYIPALEQLVNLDLAENQYSRAMERVRKQLAKSPEVAETHLLLAEIYEKQRNTNQAQAELTKAIELKPDFRAASLLLARLYIDSGRQQQALEGLNRILAKNPKDVVALMSVAMIHNASGEYEAAREAYEKVLAADPKHSDALNNLAYLYSEKLGQLEKGYDLARRARELLPHEPRTADTLGWIAHKRGQDAWALTLLDESASQLPKEPEVLFHLGMAHYDLGDEDAARLAFQRALELKKEFPGSDECARRLGILTINADTPGGEGRASLEKRVGEEPADAIAVSRLASIYEREGSVDKAVALYQAAIKANPNSVKAMANLARLFSTRPDQTAKALELAKAAYKLAPEDAVVSHTLGRLAYQTGDYKWAVSLLRETERKQPRDPGLLYDLAVAAYGMGQVADARSAMRRAVECGPDFPRVAQAKLFLEITGLAANPAQPGSTAARVGEVLKADGNYVPALMLQGALSEQKADAAAAKQTYEKVLKLDPDFVPAQRQLAILYAENPGDDTGAYGLAVKAREAFPGDPEVAKALGIIVYRQGDFARSAGLLRESANRRTDDAELMYYLGMAQYHLKQKVESKKSLQRALELKLPLQLAGEAGRAMAELK